MKILDIVYPYFVLEHEGQPFEVRETRIGEGRYYVPVNESRDVYVLGSLVRAYSTNEIQDMIRDTVEKFENEMNLILGAIDREGDLTYSERYILNMEGH